MHCTIISRTILGGNPWNPYFTFLIWSLLLLFLPIYPIEGKEGRILRYSGELLRIDVANSEPNIEFSESYSHRIRKVNCDKETLASLKHFIGKEKGLSVDGKATSLPGNPKVWLCVGKPNVRKSYQVGLSESNQNGMRVVAGQVLEADPVSGQIAYSMRGRHSYLTVAPGVALEMKERLGRMEVVEIKGNYRYNRVKRYFVEE